MIKSFALTALIGLVSSVTVFEYKQSKSLISSSWLSFTPMIEADFGYGTHWGILSQDTYTADGKILYGHPRWYTEYYGAQAYSNAKLTLTTYIFNHRYVVGEFELEPLYLVPYRQYTGFARLESQAGMGNEFGWWVAGTKEI